MEENNTNITNKDHNEALEGEDFVGIANDDSPTENADEHFEYLRENGIAINWEQAKRLGDKKKCKITFTHHISN